MKTAIIMLATVVGLLAITAAFTHKDTSDSKIGCSFGCGGWWRTRVAEHGEAQKLQTPEIQRAITEINAQIPLNTVASWNSEQIKKADEYAKIATLR